MRSVKVLTITLALMAGLMASNPSQVLAESTAFCKEAELTCSSENTFKSGTSVRVQLKQGAIVALMNSNSEVEFTCDKSHLEGWTTSGLSAPLEVVGTLSLTGCKKGTIGCVVETEKVSLPNRLSFLRNGHNSATVLLTGTLIRIVCSFLYDCSYLGPSTLSATGDDPWNPAVLTALEAALEFEGGTGTCPGDLLWDAFYEFQEPSYFFISG